MARSNGGGEKEGEVVILIQNPAQYKQSLLISKLSLMAVIEVWWESGSSHTATSSGNYVCPEQSQLLSPAQACSSSVLARLVSDKLIHLHSFQPPRRTSLSGHKCC